MPLKLIPLDKLKEKEYLDSSLLAAYRYLDKGRRYDYRHADFFQLSVANFAKALKYAKSINPQVERDTAKQYFAALMEITHPKKLPFPYGFVYLKNAFALVGEYHLNPKLARKAAHKIYKYASGGTIQRYWDEDNSRGYISQINAWMQEHRKYFTPKELQTIESICLQTIRRPGSETPK